MKLLDIKELNGLVDYDKIYEIDELRNYLSRKILLSYDLENYNKYLENFYLSYNSLKNTMLTKSAQQEAVNEKELKNYTQNLKSAFDYIVDKLNQNNSQLTTIDLLNLHRLVDPIAHQRHPNNFRNSEVLVGSFAPPKPEYLNSLIGSYIWNLNDVKGIHPLVKAGYSHHELVRIHPFIDGNGRVARLIGNYYLMKNLYAPTYILPEEKEKYNKQLGRSFEQLDKYDGKKIGKNTLMFFNSVFDREKRSLEKILERVE